jgi:hypothetical protein
MCLLFLYINGVHVRVNTIWIKLQYFMSSYLKKADESQMNGHFTHFLCNTNLSELRQQHC